MERTIARPTAILRVAPPQGHLISRTVRFACKQPLGTISAVVLSLLVLAALLAWQIAPFDPDQQFLQRRYAKPMTDFLLGGDQYGRDLLSRIIFGGRVSLFVGFASTLIGSSIGAVLGITGGYFGGRMDLVVQRMVDTLQALPPLVLAMVLVVAFNPSITSVIFAIGMATVPLSTRVIRSVALQVKELDYVTAARSMGACHARIMLAHILPQTIAPFIVICTTRIGQAIVIEATLGFLGLGVPPPTATWGQMLADSSKSFFLAPWLSIFPGLALSLAVFSVNLLGDALRDTLDPRLRGR